MKEAEVQRDERCRSSPLASTSARNCRTRWTYVSGNSESSPLPIERRGTLCPAVSASLRRSLHTRHPCLCLPWVTLRAPRETTR